MSLFKKQISEQEARQEIHRAEMRRALYQMMYNEAQRVMHHKMPCPILSDEEIKRRLKKLLL